MDRFESSEDYLENIYMLHLENEIVRAIDIANKMNFSKASVSIAMKKLKLRNLITVNPTTGNIELTSEGIDIAKRMYERHNTLKEILMRLGVPEDIARKDACKIEHDLSVESYDAIKNHLNTYGKTN
mgnify:CR=1 FL=1